MVRSSSTLSEVWVVASRRDALPLSVIKFVVLLFFVFALTQPAGAQKVGSARIRSEKCTPDNKCFVMAFVSAKKYDEESMSKLTGELSKRYKERSVVNLNIFDSDDLIKAFLEGKRSPGQVSPDRRAYYLHTADCGDILFYKSAEGKVSVVRAGWNDTVCKQKIYF